MFENRYAPGDDRIKPARDGLEKVRAPQMMQWVRPANDL
jgi:hypothetical protein